MAGEGKAKPTETGRASAIEKIREKLRKWRSETPEGQIEDAVDRIMMIEIWLYWYIEELRDLRKRLLEDSPLKQLTPIIDELINQIWSLLGRWKDKKMEVIKAMRELKRMKRKKIKGRGYTIKIKHSKYVSDVVVTLWGSETSPVDVPRIIPEEISKILKIGWYATDASRKYSRPEMNTHQLWQALSFLLLYKKVHIYAEGISVTMDDVKVIWRIYADDSETDKKTTKLFAYEQVLKLPKDQFALSLFTALLGDGSSKLYAGHRKIELNNSDRNILEAVAQKIKDEFDIRGTVTPANKSTWRYMVTGPEAQKLAKIIINNVKYVPVLRRVYDILTDYVLIGPEKWMMMKASSIYVYNQRKVEFRGLTWSVHFEKNCIFLSIETTDPDYTEELMEKMKMQGIDITLSKYTKKG